MTFASESRIDCDYSHDARHCRAGILRRDREDISESHYCPKCNSKNFLLTAKLVAERTSMVLNGCPCCPTRGSSLEHWLTSLELVDRLNPGCLEHILASMGEITVRDEYGQKVYLRYDQGSQRSACQLTCEEIG